MIPTKLSGLARNLECKDKSRLMLIVDNVKTRTSKKAVLLENNFLMYFLENNFFLRMNEITAVEIDRQLKIPTIVVFVYSSFFCYTVKAA